MIMTQNAGDGPPLLVDELVPLAEFVAALPVAHERAGRIVDAWPALGLRQRLSVARALRCPGDGQRRVHVTTGVAAITDVQWQAVAREIDDPQGDPAALAELGWGA